MGLLRLVTGIEYGAQYGVEHGSRRYVLILEELTLSSRVSLAISISIADWSDIGCEHRS